MKSAPAPRPDGGEAGEVGEREARATQFKERLRSLRHEHGFPPRTHLFLASPMAFAVFLGQALNAVGETLSYERTPGDSYQLALTLPTG